MGVIIFLHIQLCSLQDCIGPLTAALVMYEETRMGLMEYRGWGLLYFFHIQLCSLQDCIGSLAAALVMYE